MKLRHLAPLLPLLAGCPYDAEAAGLVPTDGGYWYGQPGDGGVFLPTVDAAVIDPLIAAPDREKLCILFVGDMRDETDYPRRLGTHISDVFRIFGTPPRNGQILGKDDATVSYLWRGGDGESAGMTLSFEYVLLNVGLSKTPFLNSYWLNGIQMRDGSYLDCWRWDNRGDESRTPCPPAKDGTACLDGSGFTDCARSAEDPRKCFD